MGIRITIEAIIGSQPGPLHVPEYTVEQFKRDFTKLFSIALGEVAVVAADDVKLDAALGSFQPADGQFETGSGSTADLIAQAALLDASTEQTRTETTGAADAAAQPAARGRGAPRGPRKPKDPVIAEPTATQAPQSASTASTHATLDDDIDALLSGDTEGDDINNLLNGGTDAEPAAPETVTAERLYAKGEEYVNKHGISLLKALLGKHGFTGLRTVPDAAREAVFADLVDGL